MSWLRSKRRVGLAHVVVGWSTMAAPAAAQTTPGYPEKVVQWTVQAGESCADVARAMYGSAGRTDLVLRYNRVSCTAGAPLATGTTLVLPAQATTVPTARITSVNPQARARPAGGAWSAAAPGQPLSSSSAVNTLEDGRAGIRFIDRSRVYLASNTLVVVYGTASQSQVSKSRPAARVRLDRGELQAGLAALRGGATSEAVDVDVAGGGRVSAASRDTVLRRRGARTNVSVFDGRADVESAGQTVKVPQNYGTRFVAQKPPEPPRPLPPAPAWQGEAPVVVLAPAATGGTVRAAWAPIPKAQSYRIELARDAAFEALVVREQVSADVTAFRAERLPPGRYFVRVRGIDTDDFLGIATPTRRLDVVPATWIRGEGRLAGGTLAPGRYAILSLEALADVEMARDDGAFGPVPARIDFSRSPASVLRFRRRDTPRAVQTMPLNVAEPEADITVTEVDGGLRMTVALQGLPGLDIPRDVAPGLRVRRGGTTTDVALKATPDGRFVGFAPGGSTVSRIDAVDGRGRVLGTLFPRGETSADGVAAPPEPAFRLPRIGATVPYFPLSPRVAVGWLPPTAPDALALTGLVESDGEPVAFGGSAFGSGQVGPIGLDATVRTRQGASARPAAAGGALGIRYRALQTFVTGDTNLELAPRLGLVFPLEDEGPSPQLDPSVLVGGFIGSDASWLVNVGGRVLLGRRGVRQAFVDRGQGYLLAGGTYAVWPWLRLGARFDLHLLVPNAGDPVLFRGGLSGGWEIGETLFASVQGRISPWNDVGGFVGGQFALGVRGWP
ncbi:MAG: hypothetical protein AAGN82_08570 [Myxococcota bacterium]